jgi:hypothetical protein
MRTDKIQEEQTDDKAFWVGQKFIFQIDMSSVLLWIIDVRFID